MLKNERAFTAFIECLFAAELKKGVATIRYAAAPEFK
jgi:hypothetical protein